MEYSDWLAIFIPIGFSILLALISYLWKRRKTKQLIKQFLEVTGVDQEEKWVEQFLNIKKRTDKIVWNLHNAVNAKSLTHELSALRKAANELPLLIQKLNDLTIPKNDKTRQSFIYYVSGLSTYLLACQYSLKGLEQNDEEAAKEGVRQVKIACDLMDKSFELSSNLNKAAS
ncbi:MAG: hypothetical protein WC333_05420 [Dehalococcoidia bacterium]|jgi:hypothetical protein